MKEKIQTKVHDVNDNSIAMPLSHIGQDLKNSILIVSVVINTAILITWITLQVTTRFDYQIASILFN